MLNRTDLRAMLKMNVIILLKNAGYPPKTRDEAWNRQRISNGTAGLVPMSSMMKMLFLWQRNHLIMVVNLINMVR